MKWLEIQPSFSNYKKKMCEMQQKIHSQYG